MEDLKLDDDLVTDNVPLVSGVGPLPKLLLERGLGIRQAGSIKAHPFSGCSGADEVKHGTPAALLTFMRGLELLLWNPWRC